MVNRVQVCTYTDLPFDRREILRYAGVPTATSEVQTLLEQCLEEYRIGAGKVCYLEFPVKAEGDTLELTFARTDSHALAANLEGCDRVILFAATLGLGIDRLIKKYSRLSAARALCFQAIGTQQVEALCGRFCRETETRMEAQGRYLRPRFSPGYGDLPLSLQPAILSVLDSSRKLGISLSDSLLMSPSKSVTALLGVSQRPCRPRTAGCSYCDKTDCEFREG